MAVSGQSNNSVVSICHSYVRLQCSDFDANPVMSDIYCTLFHPSVAVNVMDSVSVDSSSCLPFEEDAESEATSQFVPDVCIEPDPIEGHLAV